MRINNKLTAVLLSAVSFLLCSCADKAETSEIKTEQSIPETTEPKITEKKNIDIFESINIQDYFNGSEKNVYPPLVYFNLEDNPYWQEYSKNNADDETGYFISKSDCNNIREEITIEFRYGKNFEDFLEEHNYEIKDTAKTYELFKDDYTSVFSSFENHGQSAKMAEYAEKEIQKEYPDTEVIRIYDDGQFEYDEHGGSDSVSYEDFDTLNFEDAKKKAESFDTEFYHVKRFGERQYFVVKNTADNTYALAGVYIYQHNGEPIYCEYEYPFLFDEKDHLFEGTENDDDAAYEAEDYLVGYICCA